MEKLDELLKKNEELQEENNDLKLLIETITGYSDEMESDLLTKIHSGEKLFHVLSQAIPVPFIIIKKETNDILFSSHHAKRLFGFSNQSFLIKKAQDTYENQEDYYKLVKMLSNKDLVENFEVKLKKEDKSVFYASLFSQPILYKEQDCMLTVIYDLTEGKRAEEEKLMIEIQLQQNQKMEAIGRLSSGIAHDFNNIMGVIMGNVDLAMLEQMDDTIQQYFKNIILAINKGKKMVGQILTFSRQTEHKYEPINISSVVMEALEMLKNFIPPNITLKFYNESKSPLIIGDPVQIQQIVMNLCSNAGHAIEGAEGVIQIILKEKNSNYIQLTVKDNGPGIDKEIVGKIFEPFFTTKKAGEGTGLGLSIVNNIVKRHGGTVSVETEYKKGTSFHCCFPIIDRTHERTEDEVCNENSKIQELLELPSELLSQLESAILLLKTDDINSIINKIRNNISNLIANKLETFAKSFNYDGILNLIKKRLD